MGWISSLFGSRKRREARRVAEQRLRALLEARGGREAWPQIVRAIEIDPEADGLLRLGARALREGGEVPTAELLDRAADAPHDPQRLFELGSALLSADQPRVAVVVLDRALSLAPFDAVVRSELALAHARSGDPRRVLATLALHPCLADDPGALFELAWASLLTGDLETAQGAARQLRGAPALRHKLELAVDRARASPPPVDARDFYFVEHGAILLDSDGPLGGRYDARTLDAAWLARALGDAGAVLERLLSAPRHVVAIDDEHLPLAEALAEAAGATVLRAARGRVPGGVVPLIDAALIGQRLDAASRSADDVLLFTLTADWSRRFGRAPLICGTFKGADQKIGRAHV